MVTVISAIISVVFITFAFKEKQGWLWLLSSLGIFLIWAPWWHTFPQLALVMWFLSIMFAILGLTDILSGKSEGWSQIKRMIGRNKE